mgnify:CR=1 FL=1
MHNSNPLVYVIDLDMRKAMKELPIDLKQLRYFIHVAEFGSFTQAANHLDVAQPILSRQIRRLETTLGKSLLIRNGRGVSLTESGHTLLQYSREIFTLMDHVYEELVQGNLSGHISIGIPPTLARMLSVKLTKQFHSAMPEARLVITEAMTSTIEDRIITGRLDMGLLYNTSRSQELDLQVLAKENLYLIAPKEYQLGEREELQLHDISDLPLILPSYPNTFRKLIEVEMTKAGLKPNVILEMNSINTIIELIVEGIGCGILSKKILNTLSVDDRNKLQAICIPSLESRLYLATSNKRMITKTQTTMLQIIHSLMDEYFNNPIT